MKKLIYAVLILSIFAGTSFALRETQADYYRWLYQLPGGKLYMDDFTSIYYDQDNERIYVSSSMYILGDLTIGGAQTISGAVTFTGDMTFNAETINTPNTTFDDMVATSSVTPYAFLIHIAADADKTLTSAPMITTNTATNGERICIVNVSTTSGVDIVFADEDSVTRSALQLKYDTRSLAPNDRLYLTYKSGYWYEEGFYDHAQQYDFEHVQADDFIATYSTMTVAVINTAIITNLQGTLSYTTLTLDDATITNSTITVGVITTARIANSQNTQTTSADATITNSTTTVGVVTTLKSTLAQITAETVTNETVTNSTSTVSKIATAIIARAEIADGYATLDDATVTNSTTTVGVITTARIATLQLSGGFTVGGNMTFSGAIIPSYQVKNDSYTASTSDAFITLCTKATPMQITLPPVATSAGAYLCFVKANAATEIVSLETNSTEEINGVDDNVEMDANYDTLTIFCDGAKWVEVGRYIH